MNEKIDINYIAKKANVSRSTVSRVLTKKTNVKESTREKVEQVMAELNYHPNSMARGLATGKYHRACSFRYPESFLRTACLDD